MYFLFRYHNWTPQTYYNMTFQEKKVIRALILKEIEDRNEEMEGLT